ncbi:MAG: hypothetical protein QXK24_08385 [Ignisphaera sp.]
MDIYMYLIFIMLNILFLVMETKLKGLIWSVMGIFTNMFWLISGVLDGVETGLSIIPSGIAVIPLLIFAVTHFLLLFHNLRW